MPPEINLYMEYTDSQCLDQVLVLFRDLAVKVRNMEITRSTGSERHNACAIFTLALNKKHTVESVLNSVLMVEGVISVGRAVTLKAHLCFRPYGQ